MVRLIQCDRQSTDCLSHCHNRDNQNKAKDKTMAIEFGTWESPATVNPYIVTVDEMLEYIESKKDDDGFDPEMVSVTVIVPKGEAIKTRLNFSRAANAKDKTARVRVNGETIIEDGKDTGNVRFVFTLTKRHKPRKGAEREATDETPDETPNETPETATDEAENAPKPRKR
jgi:hypothetical protein